MEQFNTETDIIAQILWLNGQEIDCNGDLIYVDTAYAIMGIHIS